MRIGIVGSGNVGMSLARGFAAAGHEVTLGTRDPGKQVIGEWLAEAEPLGRVGTDREAVEFGDTVIVAVPGRHLPELIAEIGSDCFVGKIVIDPTNPVVMTDRGPEAAFGEDSSAAEYLTGALPGARVVKAFDQVPSAEMLDPEHSEVRVMRIAGDDAESKATVTALLESFGWRVRDLGGAEMARKLEGGALDWIRKRYEASQASGEQR
jgi:predicted dinucleotide-binding enzyme